MVIEEQRLLHEDLERLEQAIADRILEDPKHIRDRLTRDHQISRFLARIQDQSTQLVKLYDDKDGEGEREVQKIATGDPFESFKKEIDQIRDFHRRYPNEPVENLEKAYKKGSAEEQAAAVAEIDAMFTGEEGFGRFFDLTMLHEQYLNLPGVRDARRVTYLQYIDMFDAFSAPQSQIKRHDKMKDQYFRYLGALSEYLESFMRRTKPLENLDKIFASFDREFDEAWAKGEVPGWEKNTAGGSIEAPQDGSTGSEFWCTVCKKGFSKETVYESHMSSKKHRKNAETQEKKYSSDNTNPSVNGESNVTQNFKERAIAEREFRIKKLASAMQTERSDTKVNVERKQGMTERERQQELEMLYAESNEATGADGEKAESDSDGEEKIYNPLKLPLAWDGKPIPFWLYKLHGLGVEFPCEICGNFVYMGRRAFDKHFNEPRHIYGLRCLGITNTTLFREITGIDEAVQLWKKIQTDKKQEKSQTDNVVQMEDNEGNVMPEKVYYDLQKAGLL